ncbi:MAG: Trk system potassium uptake protein TrkA-like protein 1 [Chlamydiae bacterium SM23_39]|nr:MAG: Trk system potassium uptake protein TrkA-like protein 1 [Chlamydiae bacterium SM23_39]
MNIVILGAGEKGSYLANILSIEKHNITIIDKDPKKLEKISEESDVATITGYAARWKILDDLIEHKPSLFIAITGDDETNLVACAIAKNLGYPKTVARVKEIGFLSRSRLDFGRLFFVDHFIGAEVLTAYDILKHVMNPEDIYIENFAHGMIQMRTITIPENWKKKDVPLNKLALPKELIISLIRRKDEIIFPHGEDHIEPKDEVTVIGETGEMKHLHDLFNCPQKKIKSVTIVGGNSIAQRLAHILERSNIKTKIIEKDEKRCKELADLLPNSIIINKDGANIDFLTEEEVYKSDIFISCTNDDKANILISLLGKQVGCKKLLALISDVSLNPLLRELDIQFTMSEKVAIANKILSIIHAEKIISIASLCENKAKVLEIKVSAESEIAGIPLSDLKARLPKNLLVAAIENRGRVMIGKGNRIISPGDTIIIISSPEHINELQDIF